MPNEAPEAKKNLSGRGRESMHVNDRGKLITGEPAWAGPKMGEPLTEDGVARGQTGAKQNRILYKTAAYML